jgi:uncharacterized protein YcnI
VLACACLALSLPAAALAHGTIRPALVRPGSTSEFTVVIPVTAQSPPVVGLTLTAPTGTEIVDAASSPPRWSATIAGATVTWRGGPIAPGSFDSFGFRARVPSRSGNVAFSARELYADGPAPPFKLNVVLFGGTSAATTSDGGGTRTLALFALVIALVAVVLAAASLIVSLARWLRG